MSVIRVDKNKENPYLIMNKTGLKDKNLSLKAKGLLCYLLSLPDDWKIYETELVNHHKDGRDSIRSALKELLDNGYMGRETQRTDKGKFTGYNYTVYEINRVGFSASDNPTSDNPTLLSNDKLNNNKLSNKDKGIQHKVSFQRFLKDRKDLNKEAIEVVGYYLNTYVLYFKADLSYSINEWEEIFNNMLKSDVHGDLSDCIDTLKEAIDKHFETKYNLKQMYLPNNFKGTTKDNRLYESNIL